MVFEDVDVVAGSFLPVTVPVDVVVVVVVVVTGVLAGASGLSGEFVFATGGPFFGLSSVTTVVVGESDAPVPGFGTYGIGAFGEVSGVALVLLELEL